jgi:DNA replication and repair protein RecF
MSPNAGFDMVLRKLKCEGFRGLQDTDFRPGSGLNIIRGNNAQGKTSLLEAVLYLTRSKSHRTNSEAELVRHGHDQFHIMGAFQRRDREVQLSANWWQGQKRFKVNGVPQTRVSDILGKVNVVFFSPEDVLMVRGSASSRRRFLDIELSQLSPSYLRALQQYHQILRQRNELLKAERPDPDLIDAWDQQLARHGRTLVEQRRLFIQALQRYAGEAYRRIAGSEHLDMTYEPDIPSDEPIETVLARVREADLRRGATSRGPHRDDVLFLVGGRAGRTFGSQGQQRSAALAVKLALIELVREQTAEYPILMLDDVLSELDAARSRGLVGSLDKEVQCILTTTDLRNPREVFKTGCEAFLIEGGRLERR